MTAPGERLESWKEIAAYLRRDVRTVQRWEKEAGLPVHRTGQGRRGGVVAFVNELDTWRAPAPAAAVAERASGTPDRGYRFAIPLVLTLAVSSLIGLSLVTRSAHGSSMAGVAARQVWAKAADQTGSVSPDGTLLSYTDWTTGNLAIRHLKDGTTRVLTHKTDGWKSPAYAMSSAFSWDGRHVAYSWYWNGLGCVLQVADVDGGVARDIWKAPPATQLVPRAWFRDGSRVVAVVEAPGRQFRLSAFPVAGGAEEVLDRSQSDEPTSVAISPDGLYLAYTLVAPSGQQTSTRVRDLRSGALVASLVQPTRDTLVGWSGSGGMLLVSDRGGTSGLWFQRMQHGRPDGKPVLVRPEIGRIRPLGLTESGRVFYALESSSRDIYLASIDPISGRIQGPPQTFTTRYVGADLRPQWSRDGKRIAFLAQERGLGRARLVVHDLATDTETEISTRLLVMNSLRWSPSNRFFLIDGADDNGVAGLFVVGADGTLVKRIPPQGNGVIRVGGYWYLDDDHVLYECVDTTSEMSRVVVRDLRSNVERQLFVYGNPVRFESIGVAGDGPYVAGYSRAPDGSNTVLVWDGKRVIPKLRLVPTNDVAYDSFAWTNDRRWLIFGRYGAKGASRLCRLNVDSGEVQELGMTVNSMTHVALSPDGRQIAYNAGISELEVWELDNLPIATTASR